MSTPLEAAVDRWMPWAFGMVRSDWREQSTWAQTQGRQFDRIAEGLRPAVVEFATRPIDIREVLHRIDAVRRQLDFMETQCRALAQARTLGP